MGKKGKRAQAGKGKKLMPKDIGKRLNALVKKLEEELKDFDLFAPLPPTDDCAICLEPLSINLGRKSSQACCGNQICRKCFDGHNTIIKKQNEKNASKKMIVRTCPFCREPEHQNDDELIERITARVACNDPTATFTLGVFSIDGTHGVTKDEMTGYCHLIRAAELGSAEACTIISQCYSGELGFPPCNKERCNFFLRVATVRGDPQARHLLGIHEYNDLGNNEVGIQHLKISAEAGDEDAFNALRCLVDTNRPFQGKAFITKDELDKIHQVAGFEDVEEEAEEEETK